MGIKVYLWSSS